MPPRKGTSIELGRGRGEQRGDPERARTLSLDRLLKSCLVAGYAAVHSPVPLMSADQALEVA